MRIPLLVRIKGFFARDKHSYWWEHWTDQEKQLRHMDVWQIAKVINEARVHKNADEAEKLIVAEHVLSERIARIQARPGYIATFAGLLGVVGGAFLTSALQKPEPPPKCVCECQDGSSVQKNVVAPMQSPIATVLDSGVVEANGIGAKSNLAGKPNEQGKQ